jgi:hypothetical protein
MGQSGDLTDVKKLIPDAFRTTRPEKKGEALLASHFPQLGVLPQASEIVAYAIADAAVAEADRVLGHLRENHEANPPAQAELYWNKVGHALTWAATWKAWTALNEAFIAARREGVIAKPCAPPRADRTPATPPPDEPTACEDRSEGWNASAMTPDERSTSGGPFGRREDVTAKPDAPPRADRTPATPPPDEHTAREDPFWGGMPLAARL